MEMGMIQERCYHSEDLTCTDQCTVDQAIGEKYFLDYLCRCSGEEKVNWKHAMLLPININKALAATRKSQFLRDRRI